MSLVGVIILTAGYEFVRDMNHLPEADDDDVRERSSLLWSGKSAGEAEKKQKLVKAGLYAVQVFYSFFIM
ncbi:MAG: hypothetical protein L6R39_007237 [Caloplaca ligustica]|nr:MAG: hypothetical protein L6R39_007237 [Caloplaca ligustica]